MSLYFSILTPVYRRRMGFSLIELLVVIALLGVLANISIMGFGGTHRSAVDQRDRRNAQEIATVATTASAAGAKFVEPGDEEATIRNLIEGCTPSSGAFRGKTFQISPLGDSQIHGAMRYLVLTESELAYRIDGAETETTESGGSTSLTDGEN